MKNRWKQFWKDESGIGVVEIILILVVDHAGCYFQRADYGDCDKRISTD